MWNNYVQLWQCVNIALCVLSAACVFAFVCLLAGSHIHEWTFLSGCASTLLWRMLIFLWHCWKLFTRSSLNNLLLLLHCCVSSNFMYRLDFSLLIIIVSPFILRLTLYKSRSYDEEQYVVKYEQWDCSHILVLFNTFDGLNWPENCVWLGVTSHNVAVLLLRIHRVTWCSIDVS
jgi:hypothetical protein